MSVIPLNAIWVRVTVVVQHGPTMLCGFPLPLRSLSTPDTNNMPPRYLWQPRLLKPRALQSAVPLRINSTKHQTLKPLSVSSRARNKMSPTDYSQIPTPARCYVDFCLIPVS